MQPVTLLGYCFASITLAGSPPECRKRDCEGEIPQQRTDPRSSSDRRVERRVFELVIVYDRFQGTLEMHVRGGKTGRVAVSPEPSSATAARIADLHEGVGRAKQQLATVRNHFGQIEPQQIDSSDASAASEDFDNAWNALTSREQA